MAERKTRVIRRITSPAGKAAPSVEAGFSFTKEMIPTFANGAKEATFLRQYRQQAWKQFEALGLPKTTEEAWRRTDIRNLQAGSFILPDKKLAAKLPALPPRLLKT